MRLKIVLPSEVLTDREVAKVIAEAENGSFCLLPRHVDFLAALVPGILAFETEDGSEEFIGVDEGILVKVGSDVLVSTGNAVIGPDLGTLRKRIKENFDVLDDREKMARSAASKLEANLVRRFMELERNGV
jgi:F-type H+-transporting ATPase subunit epsilon